MPRRKMVSSLTHEAIVPIVSQQVLDSVKAKPKNLPHDAAILVTTDKNVLVEACEVRLECCKIRLQSLNLQLEHDKLQYQKAVEGFEKEQAVVGKTDETTLLEFLPLVREKSEYCATRCDLQSRISAKGKTRQKLQEEMEGAMAESQQAKKGSSDVDCKGTLPEDRLPLRKPDMRTMEELAQSTKLLEEQLEEKDALIAIHEETIKIDAEIFFQRSCVAQELSAKLRDMRQFSYKTPSAEAELLTEKNEKIFFLERELARVQYENVSLTAGSNVLENRVCELTRKCETYRRRAEKANNSRAYAWDRLNAVKAERDAAEDKVNNLLDLNHIISSFKEQKQGLEMFASIIEKEKKSTSSVLVPLPSQHDTPRFQNEDSILLPPTASSPPTNTIENISDLGQSPPTHTTRAGETPAPLTSKDLIADSPVKKVSDIPEVDANPSMSHNKFPSKCSWGTNTVPPIRDEDNTDGFPVFGYICEGIEGLVVCSAIFSSGAVIVSSVFLVGQGLVYGLG